MLLEFPKPTRLTKNSKRIMNKLHKFSILLGALLFITYGCKDEDLAPIVTFDSVEKGAYPRLIEEGELLINLFDIAGSQYTYTVEFVDIEQGALVSEYNLYMTYNDNNPENGDASVGPIEFRTFSQSDFTDNADGFRELSQTITANEAIAAANTTAEDIGPGDEFVFEGEVVLENGATFRSENSSATVVGAGFRGHFDFTMPCACPSDLAGTYEYTTTDVWCDGSTVTGTVDIEAQGGGVYKFSDWAFGAYGPCYGGGTAGGDLTFDDVCEVVTFTGFTDSFGDTWTFSSSLSADNTEWTIKWENTYGESATSVVVNPNGWSFDLGD